MADQDKTVIGTLKTVKTEGGQATVSWVYK